MNEVSIKAWMGSSDHDAYLPLSSYVYQIHPVLSLAWIRSKLISSLSCSSLSSRRFLGPGRSVSNILFPLTNLRIVPPIRTSRHGPHRGSSPSTDLSCVLSHCQHSRPSISTVPPIAVIPQKMGPSREPSLTMESMGRGGHNAPTSSTSSSTSTAAEPMGMQGRGGYNDVNDKAGTNQ
ncbi:uncharacterized protein BO72DRAFT_36594 [Aspergillus fijiensis CBS 313.89]|uniref:Uncharacterized protein n=1 Tax=Aspergillus fijiensis CBS 313.89 TaxID=1448319 RepID=A0A8G1RV28_9EURO|nr:uncharacterized protein BO72DRAFT_36594 [Aspergillus fijiensis CBS 313.89]RAK79779.1 hypothetical protein BO72DRAFT_36594 [Aspergillus fijiensis CBS 313.89]